ncbi:MAG: hypothetical protein J2P25_22605 [Nocardiopsaceae bacterium]|nr:hypothetical protein [Nocardiopsaceae bacterium]
MPQQFDWRGFDRTAWVLMGCGVIAFIDTFIQWATASLGIFGTVTADAWTVGFWAWFPMMLLLALGVAAFLPGLGFRPVPRLHVTAFAVSALVVLIVLIRWATYPSGIGAGFGLVLGLILAIVTGIFTFLTDSVQEVIGQLR